MTNDRKLDRASILKLAEIAGAGEAASNILERGNIVSYGKRSWFSETSAAYQAEKFIKTTKLTLRYDIAFYDVKAAYVRGYIEASAIYRNLCEDTLQEAA